MNHTLCLGFSKRIIDFHPHPCSSPWLLGTGVVFTLCLCEHRNANGPQDPVFSSAGFMPRGIAGPWGSPIFHFLRKLHPVSHSSCSILLVYPTNSAHGYNFSTFLPTVIFWFLKYFCWQPSWWVWCDISLWYFVTVFINNLEEGTAC